MTEPPTGGLDRVARALETAAMGCSAGVGRLTVLYSGGLDSSIAAWLLRPHVEVRLLCVVTARGRDAEAARSGAAALGLPIEVRSLTEDEVRTAGVRWASETVGQRLTLQPVTVALALAIERAQDQRVVCGQGADELFYGYAHFRGLSADESRHRAATDWAELRDVEWPRALRIATSLGHDLRSPYLDSEVARWAEALPTPELGRSDPAKPELRSLARRLGLPPLLVDRPKRAFQYGSGVDRVLRYGSPRDPADRAGAH